MSTAKIEPLERVRLPYSVKIPGLLPGGSVPLEATVMFRQMVPDPPSRAPALTETALAEPGMVPFTRSEPALTVTAPPSVLALLLRVSEPAPVFVRPAFTKALMLLLKAMIGPFRTALWPL